jgi:hypothetical protein
MLLSMVQVLGDFSRLDYRSPDWDSEDLKMFISRYYSILESLTSFHPIQCQPTGPSLELLPMVKVIVHPLEQS